MKKSLRNSMATYSDPPSSPEITKLVNKLVQRFICLEIPNHDQSREQSLARQRNEMLQYCMRILGSRISPTIVPDDYNVSQLIQKKLYKENGANKSYHFTKLFQRLSAKKNMLKSPTSLWAILHLLLTISESNKLNNNVQPVQFSFSTVTPKGLPNLDTNSKKDTGLIENGETSVSKSRLLTGHKRIESKLDMEISEEELLKDIIYIFQGIEGKYIKYNKSADAFVVDPTVKCGISTRELVAKLSELGWLFRKVTLFLENCHIQQDQEKRSKLPQNTLPPKARDSVGVVGLVGQSFCSAVQQELQDYYRLIAVLETQTNTGASFSLRRLLIWCQEPLQRMYLLALLVESVQGLKGGALASAIRAFGYHGDTYIKNFVNHLMVKLCQPIFNMIRIWVFEGELRDPFNEFFVAGDNSVSPDKIWHNKYTLRNDMVLSFIPTNLAQKILRIGKSINFMRMCCKDTEWVMDSNNPGLNQIMEYGQSIATLEGVVENAAKVVNKRLLELMFDKYQLYEHFMAIKRYLLLGQGDFIEYLMDLMGADLLKPANSLFRHNLVGVLESAIRASNAQYDDADIINRLDIRLLEIRTSKSELLCGWDIFSLDYHVDVPINTVFTPNIMGTYLRIFNFLWRIKRVEYSLSSTWSRHMNASHLVAGTSSQVAGDLHRYHVLRNEMVHFVNNLQHYIMFEVLEFAWEELVRTIKLAVDLDEIIEAHSKYLHTILEKSLLNSPSLLNDLMNILDVIIKFCRLQETVFHSMLEESHKKNKLQLPVEIKTHLSHAAEEYSLLLKAFTSSLAEQIDENLQFLTFRLDFNEYYERQEHKAPPALVDSFVEGVE